MDHQKINQISKASFLFEMMFSLRILISCGIYSLSFQSECHFPNYFWSVNRNFNISNSNYDVCNKPRINWLYIKFLERYRLYMKMREDNSKKNVLTWKAVVKREASFSPISTHHSFIDPILDSLIPGFCGLISQFYVTFNILIVLL